MAIRHVAPLRFASAFRAIGVCEHIWLRYKNFDPSCFDGWTEMGRIGLLCHGSNLHRFGIRSNGLGSTLKNAKFKGDNILISTQVHLTQFDLSQVDLSYSTKRVDLILFDLFHSTHFMQSCFDPIQKFGIVDLRTNSDLRSRSFDLFPPTQNHLVENTWQILSNLSL